MLGNRDKDGRHDNRLMWQWLQKTLFLDVVPLVLVGLSGSAFWRLSTCPRAFLYFPMWQRVNTRYYSRWTHSDIAALIPDGNSDQGLR